MKIFLRSQVSAKFVCVLLCFLPVVFGGGVGVNLSPLDSIKISSSESLLLERFMILGSTFVDMALSDVLKNAGYLLGVLEQHMVSSH